jgi:hypothetical protein
MVADDADKVREAREAADRAREAREARARAREARDREARDREAREVSKGSETSKVAWLLLTTSSRLPPAPTRA